MIYFPAVKTEDIKYESKFAPGKLISKHQYLAEFIVSRNAKKQGIELQYYFWNKSILWEKELKKQLMLVSSLLKIYSAEAISSALKKNPWIYSFANKKLKDYVRLEDEKMKEKQKHELENKQEIKIEEKIKIENIKESRESLSNDSIYNKLDGL